LNQAFNGKIETINGKEISFSVNEIELFKTVKNQYQGMIEQKLFRANRDGIIYIVQSKETTLAIHETLSHGQTIATEIKDITFIKSVFIADLISRYDYFQENS
jgi:hypothetical protein